MNTASSAASSFARLVAYATGSDILAWNHAFNFDAGGPPEPDIRWYWDATACVEFGLRMAQGALELELRKEADFILHFDAVRKSIDELYDLRGSTLAVLVSIALNTSGVISATKRKRYAEEVPEAAVAAIELRAREVLGLSGA